MNLGVMILDEKILTITQIRLRDGNIYVYARAEGPMKPGSADDYVILGEDGKSVVRVVELEHPIVWGEVAEDEVLTVVADLVVTNDRVAKGVKDARTGTSA